MTTPSDFEPGGYRRPPSGSRFQKGHSGNPRGRPRGRGNKRAPYDAVLGQKVVIRTNGKEGNVTAAEAFLLQMTQKGLAGDASAARAMLDAMEKAPASIAATKSTDLAVILLQFRSTDRDGRLLELICDLGMARKLDAYRETARVVLDVWMVELALSRLKERRLSSENQAAVWRGCRTPWKVNWPGWWTYRG